MRKGTRNYPRAEEPPAPRRIVEEMYGLALFYAYEQGPDSVIAGWLWRLAERLDDVLLPPCPVIPFPTQRTSCPWESLGQRSKP